MNIRHGDLALIGIKKLPAGLAPSEAKVLMTGSGGNDHIVKNGIVYPKEDGQFIVGYLEAEKGCSLLHPDHGKISKGGSRTANVPEGFYELRRQSEDTHDGMKQVVD